MVLTASTSLQQQPLLYRVWCWLPSRVDSSLGATSAYNFSRSAGNSHHHDHIRHLRCWFDLHLGWCSTDPHWWRWHWNHWLHIRHCEFFYNHRSRLIDYFTFQLRWGPSGPFFLSLPILFRWPDELGSLRKNFQGTDQIAALWRCDQYREGRVSLIGLLARDDEVILTA